MIIISEAKYKKAPQPPTKQWNVGDKVEYTEGESRIRGKILEVQPKFVLILTGYGYWTCMNIHEAETNLRLVGSRK